MSSSYLHRYFLNNNGRTIHKCNHYFDIYERHFSRFRDKSPVVLEIGVGLGGSLQMWKAYFGPGAKIIGIDVQPNRKDFEEDGIEIFIGSQDDPKLIDVIFEKYPKIDIVLDDGGHKKEHMVASFNLLYDRLQPDGVYMVEDTCTCYWKSYNGGIGVEGSFIEFAKHKMDEINAEYTKGKLPITKFTRFTDSITCYASIVAFERRKQAMKQSLYMSALAYK